MDAAEDNQVCEPWNTDYQVSGVDESNVQIACDMAARDDKSVVDKCAKAACIVETTFVNKAFAMMSIDEDHFNEDHLNQAYKHTNATFDAQTMCEVRTGTHHRGGNGYGYGTHASMGVRACCGDHPTRFPYARLIKECCADDRIAQRGTC